MGAECAWYSSTEGCVFAQYSGRDDQALQARLAVQPGFSPGTDFRSELRGAEPGMRQEA
ncbi:hypothetical protein [Corallococcus terminator]|uniref:hypothetical protein n=1 Tax=Corallococcus terminator TaxID=2316733 RepID=UPI001315550F|nr:hypothetical protein [Corallococcus terminator]